MRPSPNRQVWRILAWIPPLVLPAASACFDFSASESGGAAGTGGVGGGTTGGTGGGGAEPTCMQLEAGSCTAIPQAGCATGETCLPGSPDYCCAAGTGTEGSLCGSNFVPGTCATGLVCIGGTCRKFCQGPAECPRGLCVAYGNPPAFSLCGAELPCDLREPWKACPTGATCVPAGQQAGETLTDCDQAGEGTEPGACLASPLDCAPGRFCVDGNCQQWCRATHPEDCSAPAKCFAIVVAGKAVIIGGEQYGTCK